MNKFLKNNEITVKKKKRNQAGGKNSGWE